MIPNSHMIYESEEAMMKMVELYERRVDLRFVDAKHLMTNDLVNRISEAVNYIEIPEV